MKTNKNLLLTLALTAACCAQSAHGMSPAQSLQSVSAVANTVQKYWKPVVAVGLLAGAGYWLWSTYGQDTPREEKIVAEFKELKSLLKFEMTSFSAIKAKIEQLEKQGILIDVLKYNNNPQAFCVEDMETLYNLSLRKSWSKNHDLNKEYIFGVYKKRFNNVDEMHVNVLFKK